MNPDFFAKTVLRFPVITLLLSVVLVILAAWSLPQTKLVSNYEVFFDEDNPELLAFQQIEEIYTPSDNVIFVVTPKNKQIFTPESWTIIDKLTELAWQLPYSVRVDSLTNYQHTNVLGDELTVGALAGDKYDEETGDELPITQADLDQAKGIALNEASLLNKLVKKKADVTGVNVTFSLPSENESKAFIEVVAAARQLAKEHMTKHPGLDVKLSGHIMNSIAFKEASITDITHIVPLAFLMVLISLAIYIYMVSGRIMAAGLSLCAVVSVIIFSVISAHGLATWIGIELSPPSSNAPTIILTLAIADCIHILVTFFQSLREGKTKNQAIISSLHVNAQPIFLTSITTIIGFLSLNFSDSPPFRDLGNIVALGVLAAWFFALALMPALLALLPIKIGKDKFSSNINIVERLAEFVILKRKMLMILMTAFIIFFAAFLPKNEVNDVWSEYFSEKMAHRQASDYLKEKLTGVSHIDFNLKSGESGGITEPAFLQTMDDFTLWLREQTNITSVSSFSDTMKRLNKNLHSDSDEYYRIPQSRELAYQYLLLYELSLPQGLDLNTQLDIDRSSSKVVATFIGGTSTKNIIQMQYKTSQWLKNNAPAEMYDVGSSSSVVFAHIGTRNVKSMLFGTLVAMVLISIVIALVLKSVKFGVISFIGNTIPAVVGFGIWGLLVGRIGLGLSVVAGMTIGIVVDYSVHFLSKYLRAQRELRLSPEDAVRYAFSTVGVALLVTTFVLCINFGMLALSTFEMNADMGMLTTVTIVIALLVDFLLLPPIILSISKKN